MALRILSVPLKRAFCCESKRIKEILFVAQPDVIQLHEHINRMISEGWQPRGYTQYAPRHSIIGSFIMFSGSSEAYYTQQMVKYEEIKKL